MNGAIFWRIVWKEYRAQRMFWVSVVALTLVTELVAWASTWDSAAHRIEVIFSLAMLFAALYTLASAATLFATERESETYEFLRALPVTPLRVFAGKLVFTLAGAAAMYGVLWTLALVLARELPPSAIHRQIWAYSVSVGFELLAWGVLFSLLLKRTMVAAILAAMVVSILSIWMGLLMDIFIKTWPGWIWISVAVAVAVAVATADVWLATRWFGKRQRSPLRQLVSQTGHPRLSEAQIEQIFNRVLPESLRGRRTGDTVLAGFDPRPSKPTMLGRLLWQEMRQSAVITAVLIGTLIPMVMCLWCVWIFEIESPPSWLRETISHWFGQFIVMPMIFVFLLANYLSAPLLGSSLFLADQTGCRFRFLAEHGFPPRLVWLSRQIRGLLVLLSGLLLVLPPVAGLAGNHPTPEHRTMVGEIAGFAVLAYACGQLCSMVFRSGIMAAAFGGVLTILLCAWAVLMNWLNLSWLWSVTPLALAFLAATWLHASNWLLEAKGWRAWLRPVAAIAIPTATILIAIPWVRICQVPLIEPGFDTNASSRPMSPEERETLAIYERAVKLKRKAEIDEKAAGGEAARRKAKEEAMALALEASRRPLLGLSADAQIAPDIELGEWVLADAADLRAEGKLDAALDHCLAAERIALHAGQRSPFLAAEDLEARVCEQLMLWAAHKGQKSQRVLAALRTMEELWQVPPAYCQGVKHHYFLERRALGGDREALNELGRNSVPPFYEVICRLPWEQARAVRLLNQFTAAKFARCQELERALAPGGWMPESRIAEVLPELAQDPTYGVVKAIFSFGHFGECMMVETYRRATRLVLALEAWKLDHGNLPSSLHDLVPTYLGQIPISPYAPSEFLYEPKGLSLRMEWSSPNGAEHKKVEARQPWIACGSWSAHSYVEPAARGGSSSGAASMTWSARSGQNATVPAEGATPPGGPDEDTNSAGDDLSAKEVWMNFWVFPIP